MAFEAGAADIAAIASSNLAAHYMDSGDLERARILLEEAISGETVEGAFLSWMHALLANIYRLQNDFELARTFAGNAAGQSREVGAKPILAFALFVTAWLELDTGQIESAVASALEALEISRETGHRWGISQSLLQLGSIASAQTRIQLAAILWSAAEAIRTRLDVPLTLATAQRYNADVAASHALISCEHWDAGWREGLMMSSDEAVDYAIREMII